MKLPTIFTILMLLNATALAGEVSAARQFQQDAMEATQSWTECVHEVLINVLSLTSIKYSYGANRQKAGSTAAVFYIMFSRNPAA